jgi:hypothetical protein
MAKPFSGSWTSRWYRSKASSIDYDKGDLLYSDGTDIALATTTSSNILGICDTDKPSTDATNNRIKVLVPRNRAATFTAATTGTFTSALEGRRVDASDEVTVAVTATTYKVFTIVKCLTSSTGVFSINDPIA